LGIVRLLAIGCLLRAAVRRGADARDQQVAGPRRDGGVARRLSAGYCRVRPREPLP